MQVQPLQKCWPLLMPCALSDQCYLVGCVRVGSWHALRSDLHLHRRHGGLYREGSGAPGPGLQVGGEWGREDKGKGKGWRGGRGRKEVQ